jgi:hypothetical protein
MCRWAAMTEGAQLCGALAELSLEGAWQRTMPLLAHRTTHLILSDVGAARRTWMPQNSPLHAVKALRACPPPPAPLPHLPACFESPSTATAGMMHCRFSSDGKLTWAELVFDVMNVMQQMQRATGVPSDALIVPNCLEAACQRSSCARCVGVVRGLHDCVHEHAHVP